MKKSDLVLSFDPGKNHAAWAILRGDGELLDTGMLRSPIQNFDHLVFTRQVVGFTREIQALLARHQYFAIVAERYQIRGTGSVGEVCEVVNLMLGIIIANARMQPHIPHVDLQSASRWKNWLSTAVYGSSGEVEKTPDIFGYHQVTKQASERKKRDILPIKEHQFDAIGIGAWFIAREVRESDTPDQELLLERIKPGIDRIWAQGVRNG